MALLLTYWILDEVIKEHVVTIRNDRLELNAETRFVWGELLNPNENANADPRS